MPWYTTAMTDTHDLPATCGAGYGVASYQDNGIAVPEYTCTLPFGHEGNQHEDAVTEAPAVYAWTVEPFEWYGPRNG